MSDPLRVATFNLHAGIDGWGRPTGAVDAAVGLDADVLFVQENWRTERTDLAVDIATRTGARAHTVVLGSGYRVTAGSSASRHWQSATTLLTGNHALFLDSELPLSDRTRRFLAASNGVEPGEWCAGVVTRLPVTDLQVVELTHLRRDRARRRLVCATLEHPAGPLRCFALHGAHLSHGSLGQYRELLGDLEAHLDGDPRAILGGDLNCWGVVARRLLRGWRHAVRGSSWPSWRPHSQLDHLFVRGEIAVLDGEVVACTESDHRPVVATLSLS